MFYILHGRLWVFFTHALSETFHKGKKILRERQNSLDAYYDKEIMINRTAIGLVLHRHCTDAALAHCEILTPPSLVLLLTTLVARACNVW